MHKKFLKILFQTLIISVMVFNFASASINQEVNYQGKLVNSTGVNVTDGLYNMRFKLYTVSSGGTAIWSEDRTSANQVQVTKGLFSVMLGSVSSLSSVDFNQTLYLGVEIGGSGTPTWDGEMSPRKKLGSVTSAFNSDKLDGLDSTAFAQLAGLNTFTGTNTFATTTISNLTATILSAVTATFTNLFATTGNFTTLNATTTNITGALSVQAGSDYTTTGSQNNVNLGSYSTVRYNGASTATFTGITGGQNGKLLYLQNASAYTLTLNNQDTNSTAANRIITGTGAALAIPTDASVVLQYDSTASRWRLIGGVGSSSGGSGSSGPAFSVNRNGVNQTVTANTATKIQFTTKTFDTNSNFDNSTNYRFTPTVPGKYIFSASVHCVDSTAYCVSYIFKNGAVLAQGNSVTNTSSQISVVTAIIDMNGSTDYVEVYGFNGGGTTIGGDVSASYFSGSLLAPINSNNAAGWANDGTQSYLLDTADNVSIGSTTALSKLSVYGNFLLEGASRYLNFGTATGTNGYGIRDNAGSLEFKNNGGSWGGLVSTSATNTWTVAQNFVSVYASTTYATTTNTTGLTTTANLVATASSTLSTTTVSNLTASIVSVLGSIFATTGNFTTLNASTTNITGNSYFATTGGNVGIGTTNPATFLDVKTATNRHFGVRDSGTATQILAMTDGAAGYSPLWIDGQTLILNQSGGKVGIGTTGPNNLLDVLLTGSTPQQRISYDSTRYTTLQVDSVGDLLISPTGSNIRINDGNQYLCSGGSCPTVSTTGTGNLIVENKIFAGSIETASCPTGMIPVPASPADGQQGFCVDKYETQSSSGNAVSVQGGSPWVSITQYDARAQCIRAGKHLITEKEWQAIAHNVQNVGWNWNGGVVGTNQMSDGHSDNGPASSLATAVDTSPCSGTGQTCDVNTWNSQRRTYKLSNGEYIWDLGGNVWEWVDQINRDDYPVANSAAAGWVACSTAGDGVCGNTSTTNDAWYRGASTAARGFVRGGTWNNGAYSGAFPLILNVAPSSVYTDIGFRCAR